MGLQGDYARAEESAARAVTCFRRCGSDSVLATATALYNLGGLAKRQVRVAGAYLWQPQRISRLQPHRVTCGIQSKYAVAETSYRQALDIYQASLPSGHGEVGDTLYQLAALFKRQGRMQEAARHYALAAAAYEDAFGSTDRRVVKASSKAAKLTAKAPAA